MTTEFEGVLLINKPTGPTSFDVIRRIRKVLKLSRIGHAGTLDPLASGLMVVLLGRYTKFAGYLTEQSKVYEAIFTLGTITTTDDGEGDVVKTCDVSHISEGHVRDALARFLGPIMQVPPRFSAIRVNGERSYAKARACEEFTLDARPVEIFELSIQKFAFPHVHVRIHCSKGTYVRALARDVGELLGVGAFASAIHRTHSGYFGDEKMLSHEDITEETVRASLLKGKQALWGLSLVEVDLATKVALMQGKIVREIPLKSDWGVAFHGNEPVALIKQEHDYIKVMRGI